MGREGWSGRYFEDFEAGDVYTHPLGRTVTETDNIWFTNLTLNTNQSHFNNHYAEKTEFKKALVNSTFTLALVTGMSVSDISQNAIANLGWLEVNMPHPLFVGDTVYAESEILAKRESKSRPYAGIVTVATQGFNQNGVVVITFKRNVMVYKKAHAPQTDLVPKIKEYKK
jgi:itaconyl-CoA hydratase